MILKFFIKYLLRKKETYTNAMKVGKKIYIIDIHEYKSVDKQIKEFENALNT